MTSAETWAEWTARKLLEAGTGHAAPAEDRETIPVLPGQTAPAFAEHQGNRARPGAVAAETRRNRRRSLAPGEDDSDPSRPGDPAWRGRTARRSSSPGAARALREARARHGWSLAQAAERTGVSKPHLSLLERGLRRPSESVAEDIIDAYRVTEDEAEELRAVAVRWAGRDSPLRTRRLPRSQNDGR